MGQQQVVRTTYIRVNIPHGVFLEASDSACGSLGRMELDTEGKQELRVVLFGLVVGVGADGAEVAHGALDIVAKPLDVVLCEDARGHGGRLD